MNLGDAEIREVIREGVLSSIHPSAFETLFLLFSIRLIFEVYGFVFMIFASISRVEKLLLKVEPNMYIMVAYLVIYNDISTMYIENENNYEAKLKLQKMLPKFKLIKIDKIINFKDSNINMVFEKKRKNEK